MPPPKTLKRKRSSSSTSSPFNLNNYIESTKEVDEVLGPQSQAHKKPKRVKDNPRTKRYRKTRKSGPRPPHSPEFTNPKTVHRKRYGRNLRKGVVFSSSTLSPHHDPALDDYNLGLPGTRKNLKKEKKNPQLDDLKSSSNEDSYSPNSSNSPKPRLSQSPLSRRLKP
jgi:hypothetical protein